jgi:hypothetical protein
MYREHETPKDRTDGIWVCLARLNTPEAFGRKYIGPVVSELVDELSAFLGISETKTNTFLACTLDEGLHKLLFMYVHSFRQVHAGKGVRAIQV